MGFLDRWKGKKTREPEPEVDCVIDLEVVGEPKKQVELSRVRKTPMFGSKLKPKEIVLSVEDLEYITRELSILNHLRAGMGTNAIEFVIKGTHPQVLDELRRTPGCGDALSLLACGDVKLTGGGMQVHRKRALWGEARVRKREFFGTTSCRDPLFFYRLVKLYEAASFQDEDIHLDWLVRFLMEIGTINLIRSGPNGQLDFPVSVVEGMIELASENNDKLARLSILREGDNLVEDHISLGTGLVGFNDYLMKYRDIVEWVMLQGSGDQRSKLGWLFAPEMVLSGPSKRIDPEPFYDAMIEPVLLDARGRIDNTKRMRAIRGDGSLHSRMLTYLVPIFMKQAQMGTKEERKQAIDHLATIVSGISEEDLNKGYGPSGWHYVWPPYPFFRYLSLAEDDPELKEMLLKIVEELKPEPEVQSGLQPSLVIPQVDVNPVSSPPPEIRDPILKAVKALNDQRSQEFEELRNSDSPPPYILKMTGPIQIDESDIIPIIEKLHSLVVCGRFRSVPLYKLSVWQVIPELPKMNIINLLRVFLAFGGDGGISPFLTSYRKQHGLDFSLLDVARAGKALGKDPHYFGDRILGKYCGWAPSDRRQPTVGCRSTARLQLGGHWGDM